MWALERDLISGHVIQSETKWSEESPDKFKGILRSQTPSE